MASIKAVAIGLFTVLFASMLSSGDNPTASLSVSPSILTAGGQATIEYANPARAGDEIVVEIDDGGFPTPKRSFVIIQLDENGKGTGTWDVPHDWDGANFNAPDAVQVTCPIR